MRVCRTCGIEKEATKFRDNRTECKSCIEVKAKIRRASKKEEICAKQSIWSAQDRIKKKEAQAIRIENQTLLSKKCKTCNQVKTELDFSINKSSCKRCAANEAVARYDKDKLDEFVIAWRLENDDKLIICNFCNLEKYGKAFMTRSKECKECNKAKHRKDKRDSYLDNIDILRDKNLHNLYGIGCADYDQMLLNQKGVCAICKGSPTGKPNKQGIIYFHIDHDHITGTVRSLLCSKCNSMLGMAREDIGILRSGIKYLLEHKNNEIADNLDGMKVINGG